MYSITTMNMQQIFDIKKDFTFTFTILKSRNALICSIDEFDQPSIIFDFCFVAKINK